MKLEIGKDYLTRENKIVRIHDKSNSASGYFLGTFLDGSQGRREIEWHVSGQINPLSISQWDLELERVEHGATPSKERVKETRTDKKLSENMELRKAVALPIFANLLLAATGELKGGETIDLHPIIDGADKAAKEFLEFYGQC